jgi:hypothetical protein
MQPWQGQRRTACSPSFIRCGGGGGATGVMKSHFSKKKGLPSLKQKTVSKSINGGKT